MAEPPAPASATTAMELRLAQVEARLARIENHFSSAGAPAQALPDESYGGPFEVAAPQHREELEQQIGQNGFAIAGVIALTVGIGFMLSQPYPTFPAAVPGTIGMTIAAGMLVGAHLGRRSFGLLAASVRGAGMVLLFFATLRLYFFSSTPALSLHAFSGRAILMFTVAAIATLAWGRRSLWQMMLALLMACAAATVINAANVLLPALPLLAFAIVLAERQLRQPALVLAGIPLIYGTYFVWAIGNPILGGGFHYVTTPRVAPVVPLLVGGIFAAATLLRPQREHEDGAINAAGLLNCTLGFGCFLVHTAAAFPLSFVAWHMVAFVTFMGCAVLFWVREKSHGSTFFYALTGYVALSMALLKAAPVPAVFVWLSLQSLLVVSTAVWFRSRLIVVANFLIYVAIVLGYLFVADRETGISIGFGLVALASARILKWQKERLELKTELMRNAYLIGAGLIFPHALYHMVSHRFVALAWIALAVCYYALNFVIRSEKYRWMGHATLALTTVYLTLAGADRLEPVARVASFLALGVVFLLVSVSLKARGRSPNGNSSTPAENTGDAAPSPRCSNETRRSM